MSLLVAISVRCDECHRHIRFDSDHANLSVTDVRDTAVNDYGWTSGTASDRCFDHRRRPLPFHDNDPDQYSRCRTCGLYDTADAPMRAVHRRAIVEANASELRERHFADWTKRSRRP